MVIVGLLTNNIFLHRWAGYIRVMPVDRSCVEESVSRIY